DPSNAAAYNNLGIALKESGQTGEAISCFQKAIELNPELFASYYNLGTVYKEKGQLDEAASYYQKFLELNPVSAAAYNSLGLVFQEKGEFDRAVGCYRKALEFNPSDAAIYNNLGTALKEKGQIDEALTCFEKSLEIDPNDTALNQIFEISYIILKNGDLTRGWSLYWKFNDSYWQKRIPDKRMWDACDIRGLTILLQSDAGFGDTVQFVRYAPMIAERGARVILNCQRELISLLQSVEGLERVIEKIQRSEFDIFIPIRRLPLVFRTTIETIPANIPYIRPNPVMVQKWKDKIRHDTADLKLGLVWAAGHDDRNRSYPLDLFSPLAGLENTTFYSLQVGLHASDAKNPPEGMKIVDHTEELKDFSETAALIENLDLIVSVDTVVAHVAGALGKPVWTLLPFIADSRWLSDREDSPWYPTMKLFRQPSPCDWKSVISRVGENLQALINGDISYLSAS
ncbi:MAG: tetratricopeptide repeat-containing glycosyltransferase family protein, partial [Nitrospirota bacterium]